MAHRGSRDAKTIMGTYDGLAVLPGPKLPQWSCSCGTAGNWASRLRCRGCGKEAPARIRIAAEKAARETAKTPKGAQPRQPQGAWASGAPGGERLRKLEERLKTVEAENKALRSTSTLPSCADEVVEEVDTFPLADPDVQKVEAAHGAMVAAFGPDSARARELAAELERLRQARRQAKPMSVQLRAVERKVAKGRKALEKFEAEAKAAAAEVEAAKASLEAASAKVSEAKLRLQGDEDELQELVRKNAAASKPVEKEASSGEAVVFQIVALLSAEFSALSDGQQRLAEVQAAITSTLALAQAAKDDAVQAQAQQDAAVAAVPAAVSPASPEGQAPGSDEHEEMDLDGEDAEDLLEAILGTVEGEGAEAREQRVAAAKARLRKAKASGLGGVVIKKAKMSPAWWLK